MSLLEEAAKLNTEIQVAASLTDTIELRVSRMLAIMLQRAMPGARWLELRPSDYGLVGERVWDSGSAPLGTVAEMEESPDLDWLSSMLQPGGAWEEAARNDVTEDGAAWMDLDRAARIVIEE